jgi:hypothetical protein
MAEAEQRDREQRAVYRYEESHNLASALAGTGAPPFWICREGDRMGLSDGNHAAAWRPAPEVISTLGALGDAIAARLASIADERAIAAREAWAQRESEPDRVVAVATALPIAKVRELAGTEDVRTAWWLRADSEAPSELMVAARMLSSQAPTSVLREVLDWIRARDRRSTQDLDAMAEQAVMFVQPSRGRRPFVVGQELATWLRSVPGVVSTDGRVEPEALLSRFGVEVGESTLSWQPIDAVCCWGPTAGPAILLNKAGTHAQGAEGRRATLAHELCHLLVDRRRSLPVAEVLGGRCPAEAEKRANAFGPELLLPREIAGRALLVKADPQVLVDGLRSNYGVSAEIIAWQAVWSDYLPRLPKRTTDYLRTCVKNHPHFDTAVRRS